MTAGLPNLAAKPGEDLPHDRDQAVGVLFGSLAAAVTVIPYSVAVAGTLTLGSHLGAAAKAMRTPAIRADIRG